MPNLLACHPMGQSVFSKISQMSDNDLENVTKDAIQNIFGDSDDDEEDLGDVKHLDFASLPSFKKSNDFYKEPKKKVKKPKRASRSLEDENEESTQRELTGEELRKKQVQQDVDSIMARLRNQKTKPNELQNEVMVDETIAALMESMQKAAFSDQEFNRNKLPAIAKLKLLPSVMQHLLKPHWFGALLDANILESIKFWLEPLADGSLPSLDIQKGMFQALSEYPIETTHLRQSLVGRIVMFYTKCQRVNPKIQQQVIELNLGPSIG